MPRQKNRFMPSGTRLYGIWNNMKDRCYNPNCKTFNRYGGRGITICEEWLNSFTAFENWSYTSGYREHLTIERKDNNGNYEPSNCMWVTIARQNRNKSNSIFADINGEIKTLAEWARLNDLHRSTIYRRYKQGYRGETLISPATLKTFEIDGISKTFSEWSKETDINLKTLYNRYQHGARGNDLIEPIHKGKQL